eukprot:12873-Heterococcus_DN1.PRE.2
MCEAAATFCYPSLDLPHQRLPHHWPAACTVSSVYFAVLGYSAAEVIRMLLLLSFCCFEQSDRLGKVPRRYTAIMAVVLSTAIYVLNYSVEQACLQSLRKPAGSTACTALRREARRRTSIHGSASNDFWCSLCFA